MIGIESEIIQRAPANCVGVLVLRERFAIPCQRVGGLGRRPRRAGISLAVKRTVVSESRLLRRCVKPDVSDVNSRCQRHGEGLNGAIEVFVIERVFIVPDSGRRVGHLVPHEPDPVVSRIGLDPVHRRTSPSPDRRLHSCSVTVRVKGEIRGTTHIVLTV